VATDALLRCAGHGAATRVGARWAGGVRGGQVADYVLGKNEGLGGGVKSGRG